MFNDQKTTVDEPNLVFETPHTSQREETRPTSKNRPVSSRRHNTARYTRRPRRENRWVCKVLRCDRNWALSWVIHPPSAGPHYCRTHISLGEALLIALSHVALVWTHLKPYACCQNRPSWIVGQLESFKSPIRKLIIHSCDRWPLNRLKLQDLHDNVLL